MFHLITPTLLFTAWLLLLLVSLSVPVSKSFSLFQINALYSVSTSSTGLPFDIPGIPDVTASAGGSVTFGLWGYCTSDWVVQAAGHDETTPGECSPSHVAYQTDSKVLQLLQLDDNVNAISSTATGALVTHPIACIFTFLALCLAIYSAIRKPHRQVLLIAIVVTALATIFSTIAFIVDIAAVSTARNVLQGLSDHIFVSYGNVVWMTLASAILLWLALVGSCLSFCRPRRVPAASTTDNEKAMAEKH